MRITRGVRIAVLVAISAFAAREAFSEPPPWIEELPGRVEGRLTHRWIAPRVCVTRTTVAGNPSAEVRWHNASGSVMAKIRDDAVTWQPEYVWSGGGASGTSWKWRVDLRGLTDDPTRTVISGADGRVFGLWARPGRKISADVWVLGKKQPVIGPFPSYRAEGFRLAADGSLGVLTGSSPNPRLRTFDISCKPVFDAQVKGDADLLSVAPGGRAAILRGNGKAYVENEFKYVPQAAEPRSLIVEPNARVLGWAGGGARTLFATSVGHEVRYRLVDWGKTTTVWDIADPAGSDVERATPDVRVEGDHILISGVERRASTYWRRVVHVLDLASGKTVATWNSPDFSGAGGTVARFMRTKDGLYLVSDEAYAPFSVAHALAKADGWR